MALSLLLVSVALAGMKLCYFTKVALSDYDFIIIFLIILNSISVHMFVDISFVDIDLCFLKAA